MILVNFLLYMIRRVFSLGLSFHSDRIGSPIYILRFSIQPAQLPKASWLHPLCQLPQSVLQPQLRKLLTSVLTLLNICAILRLSYSSTMCYTAPQYLHRSNLIHPHPLNSVTHKQATSLPSVIVHSDLVVISTPLPTEVLMADSTSPEDIDSVSFDLSSLSSNAISKPASRTRLKL